MNRKHEPIHRKINHTPVVILVVNPVHNAQILYRSIVQHKSKTGEEVPDNWFRGKLKPYFRIVPNELEPNDVFPMYWAQAKISGECQGAADYKKAIAELFEIPTHAQAQTQVLETIRSFSLIVFPPASSSEHFRFTVLVSTISDDWNAKTVTPKLRYRKQESTRSHARILTQPQKNESSNLMNRNDILFVIPLFSVKQRMTLPQFNVQLSEQFDRIELGRARSRLRDCCISKNHQPAIRELMFVKGINGNEPLTSDTQKRNFGIINRHCYLNYGGCGLVTTQCNTKRETRLLKNKELHYDQQAI